MIADDGEHMLIWADIMHVDPLQLPHPDWSVLFDVNRTRATDTRAGMLDRLATDGTRVMGSHLSGRGRISHEAGGFVMRPA